MRIAALALGLGLAGLTASCASGSKSPTVASTGASATSKVIAYSRCMRSHGVPGFPDPNSHGNILITPSSDIDPSAPVYQSAQQACARFRAAAQGPGMTPAQHAAALARLTQFTDCMRKHQIPMADPFSGPNGGVGIAVPRSV